MHQRSLDEAHALIQLKARSRKPHTAGRRSRRPCIGGRTNVTMWASTHGSVLLERLKVALYCNSLDCPLTMYSIGGAGS
jgi:hypothetical protein